MTTILPATIAEQWMGRLPAIFLVISSMTSVVGLCLFSFLSNQVRPHVLDWIGTHISFQNRYISLSMIVFIVAYASFLLILSAPLITRNINYGTFSVSLKAPDVVTWWYTTVYESYGTYKKNLHLQRNIYWYICFPLYEGLFVADKKLRQGSWVW